MAHCLRHISNKITSLNSIIGPKSVSSKYEKINLKSKNNYLEQYSTQPKCKTLSGWQQDDFICRNADNRECQADVVTKFNINLIADLKYSNLQADIKPKEMQFSETDSSKPSPDKLSHVYDVLMKDLPNFFTKTMNYTIYEQQLIFENNIRGTTTVGLYHFVKQMALLRAFGHLKFAYLNFEVLKITKHPEDSTIKVRWRIRGVSALKVFITFWKYKLWQYKEMFEKEDAWYDGFSTFHVNTAGLVYKHVADKMMPDSDSAPAKPSMSPLGTAKLALIIGLIPRFADIYS